MDKLGVSYPGTNEAKEEREEIEMDESESRDIFGNSWRQDDDLKSVYSTVTNSRALNLERYVIL